MGGVDAAKCRRRAQDGPQVEEADRRLRRRGICEPGQDQGCVLHTQTITVCIRYEVICYTLTFVKNKNAIIVQIHV